VLATYAGTVVPVALKPARVFYAKDGVARAAKAAAAMARIIVFFMALSFPLVSAPMQGAANIEDTPD